jgi:hypothetical protein
MSPSAFPYVSTRTDAITKLMATERANPRIIQNEYFFRKYTTSTNVFARSLLNVRYHTYKQSFAQFTKLRVSP